MPKKRDAEIEKLIEEITGDCYNEDEQLTAFEVTINDAIDGYAKALHMDEPVYLVEVNFDQASTPVCAQRSPARARSLKCRCWI
jgi:hypothetical protein